MLTPVGQVRRGETGQTRQPSEAVVILWLGRKETGVGGLAVADGTVDLEQHRAELTGYCYRMLGSSFDADDAVQETMVRAWQGLARFGGRAALRSWLSRIPTNVSLDSLRGRQRRALPMDLSSPV